MKKIFEMKRHYGVGDDVSDLLNLKKYEDNETMRELVLNYYSNPKDFVFDKEAFLNGEEDSVWIECSGEREDGVSAISIRMTTEKVLLEELDEYYRGMRDWIFNL
ncbi:hypothetical protein [Peptostreptococcus faecalis]|uniref:hypothetical protein n=1 Tax=Peptostreptococcus faecalis TaxID=2045015 RepID=UPI000C7C6F48|nr:hypothetical protein [Peptostreptococcus faecalis]